MQHQWDEMHRTRKPTFVLCGEPQGDVLNLYVHGYSATSGGQNGAVAILGRLNFTRGTRLSHKT